MDNNWFKKLFIDEAKPALYRHSGSSNTVVEPLTVTKNGTYNPPPGVDGYNPVIVAIPTVTKLDTPVIYLEA